MLIASQKIMTTMMRMPCLIAALVLSWLAPACQAQLYKWVDANGQTHYSDRKEEAGKARVDEMKVAIPSNALQKPVRVPGQQQFEAAIRRRQIEQGKQAAAAAHPLKPSRSYYTNEPETDASRCTLAQDITSGRARHRFGAPTDANDRAIANQDIKRFCH
jgi:hypothetical protein